MTASEPAGSDRSLRIRQTITVVVIAALLFIAWRNQIAKTKAEQAAQAEATALKSKEKTPSKAKDEVKEEAKLDSAATKQTSNVAPEISAKPPAKEPAKETKSAEPSTKSPASPSQTASPKKEQSSSNRPAEKTSSVAKTPVNEAKTGPPKEKKPEQPKIRTKIDNQTIRNEEGEVVFKGTVDLGETVERVLEERVITRFRNDGIVFQNRERRLPNKPPGYYREWVHPTPGLGGPGPQRIVTGEGGEVYYTSNHYKSFIKLN